MHTVFVGTYTQILSHVNGRGTGIYMFSLEDNFLRAKGAFQGLANPSFLTVDVHRHHVYAVSEVTQYEEAPQGAVEAWSWNPKTDLLNSIGTLGTQGGAPCYISISNNHLLIANYISGSVTAINLSEGDGLGDIDGFVQHSGSGPNTTRQKSPHPHAIVPDPTGTYCLVPDLGTDKVHIYPIDSLNQSSHSKGEFIQIHPGAGPRHLSFHPSGERVYVINELDSTISLLSWKGEQSEIIHTFNALPDDYTGPHSGADIHVHPSGNFLYASLRGISCIVCFQIDKHTGHLSSPQWFPTHGRVPRNFALDPTGELLIVANQDSDTLIVFRVDPGSGFLDGPKQILNVPSPVCVKII
ncbi:MAG: lactonase family protein [Bacteroidetes bacterium]|nr:lactonase family protein [Bacteroidota bacterium]